MPISTFVLSCFTSLVLLYLSYGLSRHFAPFVSFAVCKEHRSDGDVKLKWTSTKDKINRLIRTIAMNNRHSSTKSKGDKSRSSRWNRRCTRWTRRKTDLNSMQLTITTTTTLRQDATTVYTTSIHCLFAIVRSLVETNEREQPLSLSLSLFSSYSCNRVSQRV